MAAFLAALLAESLSAVTGKRVFPRGPFCGAFDALAAGCRATAVVGKGAAAVAAVVAVVAAATTGVAAEGGGIGVGVANGLVRRGAGLSAAGV